MFSLADSDEFNKWAFNNKSGNNSANANLNVMCSFTGAFYRVENIKSNMCLGNRFSQYLAI